MGKIKGDSEIGMQRRVQHYGYKFDYQTKNIDITEKIGELPDFCDPFIKKLKEAMPHPPDQLTINEYHPGQGIRKHVDTHSAFEDGIASLSLSSAVVFEMRHPIDENKRKSLLIKPRTLLIMTKESRYLWYHLIAARKTDLVRGELVERKGTRISLTFRKVRAKMCNCEWPLTCDSSPLAFSTEAEFDPKILPKETHITAPTNLEKVHVHKFYEEVAEHFR